MPETSPAVSQTRTLRYYRAQNAIWLWLGLAAQLALVAWILDPAAEARDSAIGRQLSGPLDDAWHVLLGVGGVFISYGIWWLRVRAEIVGHLCIAVAVGVNCVAILVTVGLASSALILFGVAAASAFRMWYLWIAALRVTRDAD